MPFGFMDWESLGDFSQKAFNKLNFDKLTQAPEYPMLDTFNQHVAQMPTFEQYAPSKLRRAAGAIGGFATGYRQGAGAGFDVADKIVRAPYNNALQDWQRKGQNLAQAANTEVASGRVENARNSALMKYYNDQERNRISSDKNDITNRFNQGKLAIDQQKADTLNEQIRQKGLERNYIALPPTTDGRVVLVDKRSGNRIDVGEEGEFFGPAQVADAAWERAKLASNTQFGVARMNNDTRIQTTGMNNENDLTVAGINQENSNYRAELGANTPSKSVVTDDRKLQEFVNQPENFQYVNKFIVQSTDTYGQPTGKVVIDFNKQNEPGFQQMLAKFQEFKKPKVTAPRPRPTTSTPKLTPGGRYKVVNP